MERRMIELRIAGQKYRVVSSATVDELNRLAELVSTKLSELGGRPRGEPGQAMLLAALALAHDVVAERERRASFERRTRELLSRTLGRIDDALTPTEVEEDAARG